MRTGWGLGSCVFVAFIFFILPAQSRADFRLESKIKHRSGLIERFVDESDMTRYQVRLSRPKKDPVWLETLSEGNASSKTFAWDNKQAMGVRSEAGARFFMREVDGRLSPLGFAQRIFDKAEEPYRCSALSVVDYPTPLSRPEIFILSGLKCSDPIASENSSLKVQGRRLKNWLTCESEDSPNVCWWKPSIETSPEAALQNAAFTHLWRAEGELMLSGINVELPQLQVYSWAFDSNRSLYSADEKTLFLGKGKFADALDGFVVSHEWAHFLIDELNPQLIGGDAQIIHEALADFYSANYLNSSCVGPFDAQEVDGRDCLRNLENANTYPQDFSGSNRYFSSLILSGALWEARKFIPSSIMTEVLLETVIRLPKVPSLSDVWPRALSALSRMNQERVLLRADLKRFRELGIRRGLLQASIEK